MDFTLDYASLAKTLESQELESPAGQTSAQVYGQLLAIHLLFNDLTSARLLWKRIPEQIKTTNNELALIWTVGKLMWKKNYAEIYPTINSCPVWPNHLKNIMKLILESTRQRVISLISRAYSSLSLSNAAQLLGLSPEETLVLAGSLNWSYDSDSGYFNITQCDKTTSGLNANKGAALIVGQQNKSSPPVLGDGTELLEKLTDYIIFLESTK